jgi:hypothetical protein
MAWRLQATIVFNRFKSAIAYDTLAQEIESPGSPPLPPSALPRPRCLPGRNASRKGLSLARILGRAGARISPGRGLNGRLDRPGLLVKGGEDDSDGVMGKARSGRAPGKCPDRGRPRLAGVCRSSLSRTVVGWAGGFRGAPRQT